jgi:hypothetical protein
MTRTMRSQFWLPLAMVGTSISNVEQGAEGREGSFIDSGYVHYIFRELLVSVTDFCTADVTR